MIFAGESPLRMDRFSPKVCCSLLRLKSYALSRELLEAAFPEREVDDADFLERSVAIWLVDVEFGCGALFKKKSWNRNYNFFKKLITCWILVLKNSWTYLLLLEDEDIVVKETLTELEDTDVDNVDLFVVCLLRSLANCCWFSRKFLLFTLVIFNPLLFDIMLMTSTLEL